MSVLLYSFYFCHCYLLVAVAMPSPLSSRSLCIEIHWYPPIHSHPSIFLQHATFSNSASTNGARHEIPIEKTKPALKMGQMKSGGYGGWQKLCPIYTATAAAI